ncbi:14-3-3 protein 9, partial [Tanacetum coccineum]
GAISAPIFSLKGSAMVQSKYPTAFPMKLFYHGATTAIAESDLPPTNPTRLGVALNFSIFHYEIMANAERSVLENNYFFQLLKMMIIIQNPTVLNHLVTEMNNMLPKKTVFIIGAANIHALLSLGLLYQCWIRKEKKVKREDDGAEEA